MSNGWADREAEAESLRKNLVRAFKGAQGQEMVAQARGLAMPQCGPGDAFTAGGRAPALAPKGGFGPYTEPGGTAAPEVEQYVFEWEANQELCRFGDPSFVASVAIRLADGEIDQASTDWTAAYLRVRFGSDNHGPLSIVDVDMMNGASVPLIGRRASFHVVYPVDGGTVQNPNTQPLIDVSISVGVNPGNSAGVRGARKSVRVGGITQNQTSGLAIIPPYAVSAVYTSNDATVQATLNQTRSVVGGSVVIASSPAFSKLENVQAPIASGARAFSVGAAANMATVRVIFLLNPA